MSEPTLTLPTRLTLAEEGQWESPSWAQTSDDDEWTSYGWKAWTYDGVLFFRHQEKSVVQQWLADNGYTDTGDGAHYERPIEPEEPVLIPCRCGGMHYKGQVCPLA